MRIAYAFFSDEGEDDTLLLWPSSKCGLAYISISYTDEGNTLALNPSDDCAPQASLLGWLAKNVPGFSRLSLLEFFDAALKDNSRQVAWDENLLKWRNVSTMRERDNMWTAAIGQADDGTSEPEVFTVEGHTFRVEATTEAAARRRMVRVVGDWMTQHGAAKAAKAASWFACGQELKIEVSGALPTYTSLRARLGLEEQEETEE